MRQEFLFLADKAEAINGKLYVLGGAADVHRAVRFPTNLLADVAAAYQVDWGETNREFPVKIDIVDEDERVEASLELTAVVGRPPQAKPGQSIRSIIALRGPFPIGKPGGYKVVMSLDGQKQEPAFRFWIEQVAVAPVKAGG